MALLDPLLCVVSPFMKLTGQQCLLAYSLVEIVFSAGSIASCFPPFRFIFSVFVLFFKFSSAACGMGPYSLSGIEPAPYIGRGRIPATGPMEEALLPH